MYYNCGALFNGERVPNKKRLRELLAESPVDIYFDGTAMVKDVDGYRGNELPEGVILSVVLPDPYHDRRFYANVRNKGGKLTVK